MFKSQKGVSGILLIGSDKVTLLVYDGALKGYLKTGFTDVGPWTSSFTPFNLIAPLILYKWS